MERFKKSLLRLLYPPLIVMILLLIVSTIGLCYVFSNHLEESILAYIIYMMSFYTLSIFVITAPPVIKKCHALIYCNTHAARYLTEAELRTRISLYGGTLINFIYAVFKLLAGVYYRSSWFGAVAVYYMILGLIRFLIIKEDRRSTQIESEEMRRLHEWRSYRACGWLLLVLNVAMTGMVVQMIWQNKGYSYPGFVIYALATYTFYRLTMAIIRIVKVRKINYPVFYAAKVLDLSIALMAIFTLQTAMFDSFGSSETFRRLMNALTGGVVCCVVVCIAVFMIIRSNKAIKEIEINKAET